MANITNIFTNITSPRDFMALPNLQTGGWFWFGMEFMVFVILTILMLSFGFEVAVITASFICLLAGLALVYLGLMSWKLLMIWFGIIIISFILKAHKSPE